MTAALIVPRCWFPTKFGAEIVWDDFGKRERRLVDRFFRLGTLKERIRMMSGSDCTLLQTSFGKLAFGKTAYAGETTCYHALYTAAIDPTLLGNTANETVYSSYARLALTNNTTIFAAGSGTPYVNSWPADTAKNFPTCGVTGATVSFLGVLNGNAGTSADKGMVWASITATVINTGDTPQLAVNAVTQTRT